jgi:hypothetical protein
MKSWVMLLLLLRLLVLRLMSLQKGLLMSCQVQRLMMLLPLMLGMHSQQSSGQSAAQLQLARPQAESQQQQQLSLAGRRGDRQHLQQTSNVR